MATSRLQLHDDTQGSAPLVEYEVRDQLVKILSSEIFKRSPRSAAFLQFVVEQSLSDRSDFIKARTIAIAVFDRRLDDNPDDDSIVRIQAGRVRKRLKQYYQKEGAQDAIRIAIPTGAYNPVFQANQTNPARDDVAMASEARIRRSRVPRIGVLPLKSFTDSPEHDSFADGLGHELSAELSRFHGLAVLAYGTTSQLRGHDIDLRAAAADLKTDFFVGGSVARRDDHIRINIECLDAQTGEQIWGECFDRSLTTRALFDIQDEVARKVVSCVGDDFGSVSQSVFRGSQNKRVEDLSAYEAVLAVYYFAERLDKASCVHALRALEHAVDIEPSYARAWAALGHVYCDIYSLGIMELDGGLEKAEDCAHRAMALDKHCQHTHFASTFVGGLKKDQQRVGVACDMIVYLNPNATHLVASAAFWLGVIGRFDEAQSLLERCKEINRSYPGWYHFVPWLQAFSNQDFDSALKEAYKFNIPTLFWDPLLRAAALGKLGRESEAVKAVQELLNLQPDFATRANFYVGCFVHSDATHADVLDGLRVGGLHL